MNLKTTIFRCSKNCGSPTRVTRLKVAPNMADRISLKDSGSCLKWKNTLFPQYSRIIELRLA